MIKIEKSKSKKISKTNQAKKEDKKIVCYKLFFAGCIATFCFLGLICRLSYLQFIKGKEYSQMAYNQQMKNKIISPKRGTIYDCNGEILALSVAVDTVSINPGKVCNQNNKKVDDKIVAEGLSQIFSLDYEETLKKVSSDKSVVIISRKVETEKITELQKWMKEVGITTGINIDEDSKRYYPNNDVASNLIGFCSTDNVGLWGIEERWNDTLTGTSGKIVTAKNVNGEAISDENEQYVAVENGSNIYLTIDAKIQGIAEKYLEQAVTENKCTNGGNVIIMNPQNGDILAMATYPDYNLNDPFSITPLGIPQEEWDALPQEEQSADLLNLWKNRAVSDLYEPGSTFKLITAAVGLEENIVSTDTEGDFYCTGSYHVGDRDISCWKKDGSHGVQTLRQALQNSCNPAFMQLGQRIGHRTLYKYYEAFELFSKVGDDIAKAYEGIFFDENKIVPVELATMSFGQRITITPLQLISSVSAIANDGVYVKPRIVKQIENTDEKSIENVEVQEIRQVISLETSQKIKNMMQSVVTHGTGRYAKVEGYSVGGKSGTSEPTEANADEGYVASFIAISPIENTQVVVLVILYDPQGVSHQGGQTAGPVAAQILSEVLPYMGIPADTTETTQAEDNLSIVPNVVDKTVAEAKKILTSAGFNVQINISGDENTTLVSDQTPKSGIKLATGATIYLYTAENEARVSTTVPNVKGMSVSDATNTLRAAKLNITVEGTKGIVVSQEPSYETEQEVGTVVHVVIKEELKDGQ
ncbi:MAG: PASTA domain-containing protein [Clostridia bacterium]|nr:PASTA domain-containing protein [Clostridia bacterium]